MRVHPPLKMQEFVFDWMMYFSYFLLIVSSLGISAIAPTYSSYLDYYIRVYICLFLILRFNPLRQQYKFTNLDRKIAFSAGMFILTTTFLNEYLEGVKHIFLGH